MKPPLNHMMLHADTLADEFDDILNYRVSHEGLVLAGWPDDDAKQLVYDGAGVTDGVTPGVAGVFGTDYGFVPASGAGLNDEGGFTVFNITQASDFTGHASFLSNGTGTGTAEDPYTISDCYFYNAASVAPHFVWNDPDADYHIKFKNCGLLDPEANANMFDIIDAGSGTLTLDNCLIGGIANNTVGYAFVKVVIGSVTVIRSSIQRASGYCFWTAGATASITVTDSNFDTDEGPAGWRGSFGTAVLFYNSVAGGTINVTRTTCDHKSVSRFLLAERDCTVTLDRLLWNGSDDATPQGFISTNESVVLDTWDGGLTMTDCRIYNGSAAVPLIGHTVANANRAVANWTITHCEFIASGTRGQTTRLIAIGDGDAAGSGSCDNVLFSWCRFTKTQTTNPTPPGAAGAEAVEFWRASDTICEYCWVDQCGEDAYEWVQPYDGCGIRYCGGGEVSGSAVNGNMVDFYAGGSNWANSTNCFINHIWGTAKADAIICEVPNVAIDHIDVTNSGADFADNLARANVRLHVNAASGLNGVTVGMNLTAVAESWDSRPCYLTREPTAETTITGTEVTGETVLTVASSAGMSNGMMVGIELATGGMYQTTISNVAAGEITIPAPGLPSNSKLNGEVYAVSAFNAGTVSWPEWSGGAFVTRDGTAGGVAEMSSI